MSDDPRSAPPRPGGAPQGGDPAGGGGDPSMEDILASIRRILNEDEATPPPAEPPSEPTPQEAEPEGEEPLDLSEDMLVPESAALPEPDPAPPPPPSFEAPLPAPPRPAAPPPAPEPAPLPLAAEAGLIGAAPAAAAAASVGTLLRAVAQERSAAVHRGGPTIEDVVREELRPLLKEWLDLHLPPLVERLVRAEIERVVGRALS